MNVFASDYDGTLRTAERVSEKDIQAIAKWRAEGNLFALVSGRSMESIRREIELNAFEVDILIGNNGGAIYDANFQEVKSFYFPFDRAMDILSYIKQERTISYVLNDGYHRSKTVLDPSREDKKYAQQKMKYSEQEILARKKIAQIVVSLDCEEDTTRIANHSMRYLAPLPVLIAISTVSILHRMAYPKPPDYPISSIIWDYMRLMFIRLVIPSMIYQCFLPFMDLRC